MEYENTQYLVHHGIKGQKWGIRRYQNEDGSLTAEGRERYGFSGKDQTYKGLKREARDYKKALRKTQRSVDQDRRSFIKYDQLGRKDLANSAQKSYEEGKKEVNSLLKDAKKAGLNVESKDVMRHYDDGELWVGQFLFGLPGNLVVSAIEMGVHKAQSSAYEGDSQYYVKSKRYRVNA